MYYFYFRTKITKLLIPSMLAVCSAALTTIVYSYVHSKRNEAIFFFGNLHEPCSFHKLYKIVTVNTTQKNECCMCKLNKIIGWITEAKTSIDLCIYMFSSELILNAIIDAHKRGVVIRLIVDNDSIKTTWVLGQMGIMKRIKKSVFKNNIMHHKFIIIDNNKLISGSLNWTMMAIRNNWENIFITNDHGLVDPFKREFERLWIHFT